MKVHLRHNGKDYFITHFSLSSEFYKGLTDGLYFRWEENTCDCEKSKFIKEQCDPDFIEMHCGDEIEFIGFVEEEK